jgi:hypothetical protein
MHIGDRYPIVSAGYFGPTGSPSTGYVNPVSGNRTGNGNTPGTGEGQLQLSRTSITWTYTSNGDVPASVPITVTGTAGRIDYIATVESSSPWLTVNGQPNTTNGSLPTTLSIAPNGAAFTGLGTGTYLALVQVSGSDGSTAFITVNLTVNNGATGLTLSPTSVSLQSQAGGLVVQQPVSVTSSAGGTLTATISGTGLSVSLSDTTAAPGTPVTATVVGNPAGLSAQTYRGVLSVAVGGVTEEEQVSFAVASAGNLQVSPATVGWAYTTGGTVPQSVTVTVTSFSGGGTLVATAASVNSWLLVNGTTRTTGAAPGTLTLSPNSSLTQLGTGVYTGTVQLTGADGSLAYINVNLTVNGGTATGLTVSPNPISLSTPLGGAPTQQTVSVTSTTGGTLSVTVIGSGLSVSIPNTTVEANTATTFTLTANPAGLSATTYNYSIAVTVGDVTQNVEVTWSLGAVNSGTNGITPYAPVPTFSFEDLGLSLKVIPTVHSLEETSLDIDAEFKVLSGQSVDGVPIITNRVMKSKARVRNGEWAVVGGLLNTQEARNIAGLAGMARIPGLGALFSTREKDTNKNEVIILMRPVLLTPPNQAIPRTYATGTDTKPVTPF